jgi:hypothetical protein
MDGWMEQEEYDTSDTNAEPLFFIPLVFWCPSRVEARVEGVASGSFCSSPPALQVRVSACGRRMSRLYVLYGSHFSSMAKFPWDLWKIHKLRCGTVLPYLTSYSSYSSYCSVFVNKDARDSRSEGSC